MTFTVGTPRPPSFPGWFYSPVLGTKPRLVPATKAESNILFSWVVLAHFIYLDYYFMCVLYLCLCVYWVKVKIFVFRLLATLFLVYYFVFIKVNCKITGPFAMFSLPRTWACVCSKLYDRQCLINVNLPPSGAAQYLVCDSVINQIEDFPQQELYLILMTWNLVMAIAYGNYMLI